jgi:hypothetical protein
MFAISHNYSDIVEDLLLYRGADVNTKGQSKHQDWTASDLRASLQTILDTPPSCSQYVAITVTL